MTTYHTHIWSYDPITTPQEPSYPYYDLPYPYSKPPATYPYSDPPTPTTTYPTPIVISLPLQ